MDDFIERMKDLGSTIPGLILSVTALIALFKEYAQQLIDAIADLGYKWEPDPTTVALVLIIFIGLKMVFYDGPKKGTKENPIVLKNEAK